MLTEHVGCRFFSIDENGEETPLNYIVPRVPFLSQYDGSKQYINLARESNRLYSDGVVFETCCTLHDTREEAIATTMQRLESHILNKEETIDMVAEKRTQNKRELDRYLESIRDLRASRLTTKKIDINSFIVNEANTELRAILQKLLQRAEAKLKKSRVTRNIKIGQILYLQSREKDFEIQPAMAVNGLSPKGDAWRISTCKKRNARYNANTNSAKTPSVFTELLRNQRQKFALASAFYAS